MKAAITKTHSNKLSETAAKLIRVITIPPILVLTLVLILYNTNNDIFSNIWDVLVIIFTLAVIPITAYPLQKVIPGFKDKGREGQRKLAFITNFLGYTLAAIWGILASASKDFKLIVLTYFLSVVILSVFNKCLNLRASGHACSITGPLILLIYFIGVRSIVPCLVIAACIVWASLKLKRHTITELFMGALTCVMSFFVTLILLE